MPKPDFEKKSKRNYLTIPDDFEIPATEDGDTFEAVAEIRKEKDGRYCVVSLDGVPMKRAEDAEDAEDEEAETIGASVMRAAKETY